MMGPSTRGKKNANTPGKNSENEGVENEDFNPKEEINKLEKKIMEEMGELKSFIQGVLCKDEGSPHKREDNEFGGFDMDFKRDPSLDNHVLKKFIPKLDMRNFDGKDPTNWLCQMEQFFIFIMF
jgi:hypothetical protein